MTLGFHGFEKPLNPHRGQKGITLLELLAALSLATVVGVLSLLLYRQGRQTLTHFIVRENDQTHSAALSHLLSTMVRDGQGLRSLSEKSLEWVSRDGRDFKMEQAWGDSVIELNGKARIDSACHLNVSAFGPALNPDPLASPAGFADTLDDNHDGLIDFSELDRDRNGTLDTLELTQVRLVEIVWNRCNQPGLKHRHLISPRNRVGPAIAAGDI